MKELSLNYTQRHLYTAGLSKEQGPVVLFLHGLKLIPEEITRHWCELKQHYDYLAPAGPIPTMPSGEDGLERCYSWYLFDRQNERYLSPMENTIHYLEAITAELCPGRDIVILGFSQGAYLAPHLLKSKLPIKAMILLAGRIRSDLIPGPNFELPIWQFHDPSDPYVDATQAKKDLENFCQNSKAQGQFIEVPGMGHFPHHLKVEKKVLEFLKKYWP